MCLIHHDNRVDNRPNLFKHPLQLIPVYTRRDSTYKDLILQLFRRESSSSPWRLRHILSCRRTRGISFVTIMYGGRRNATSLRPLDIDYLVIDFVTRFTHDQVNRLFVLKDDKGESSGVARDTYCIKVIAKRLFSRLPRQASDKDLVGINSRRLLLKGAASAASTSTMDTASAVAVIVPHDCIYSIAVVWHLFLLLFKASNATILIKDQETLLCVFQTRR